MSDWDKWLTEEERKMLATARRVINSLNTIGATAGNPTMMEDHQNNMVRVLQSLAALREADGCGPLHAAAPKLLEALEGLTQLGVMQQGHMEGAIIVGPQGWHLAQEAIAEAKS